MKVLVTKDYYNGYRSITKEMHLEDITGSRLALVLCEDGVASITITRSVPLQKMIDDMDKEGAK
jgi:hypothetical protein